MGGKLMMLCKILTILITSLLITSCGMRSLPMGLNKVEASWAQVQNQYKRRSDLIPSLVSTVKGYAKHEKSTLQAVIEARSRATQTNVNAQNLNPQTLKQFSQSQSALGSALSRLMVVVEKYPQLRANENFRDLQNQLEGTENRISIARKEYILSVKEFNNLVTVPPTSWFNSLLWKHKKKPQFTAGEASQSAPKVQF